MLGAAMNMMDQWASLKSQFRQSTSRVWLLVIFVVGGIFALILITTIYKVIAETVFTGSQQEMAQRQNGHAQKPLSQITQAPLFGKSEQAATTRVNTNLLLLGVIYSADKNQAAAIIASQGKEPEVYRINEEVSDGGRLQSIYPDRVLLRRSGRLETLYLDWSKRDSSPASSSQSVRASSAPATAATGKKAESSTARRVPSSRPPQPQRNGEWQKRLEEIREKYKHRFESGKTGAPGPIPFGLDARGPGALKRGAAQ